MNFEEIKPLDTIRPIEPSEKIEDTVEGQIEEELVALRKNMEGLQNDAEELQHQEIEGKIDDKKKRRISSNTKNLIFTVSTLLAVPVISNLVGTEKTREINQAISDFVNQPENILKTLAVLTVIMGPIIYKDIIKVNLDGKKATKELGLAVEMAEKSDWDQLGVSLDSLAKRMAKFSYYGFPMDPDYIAGSLKQIEAILKQAPEDKRSGLLAGLEKVKTAIISN